MICLLISLLKHRRADGRQVRTSCCGRRPASRSSKKIEFFRMITHGPTWVLFDDAGVISCLHCGLDTAVETRASGSVSSRGGDANMRSAISSKSRHAEGPKAPSISIPTGRKKMLPESGAYFASFLSSAAATLDPDLTAVACTRLGTHVWMIVSSQVMGRPLSYGSTVAPSCLLRSTRAMPGGSRADTIPTTARACLI